MDQENGTTSPKKKQVLFSISSYGERDKRVINKISTNGLFASATTEDVAPIRPQPTRTSLKTRPVSLNFLDTSSKFKTLPARHRYNDELDVEKPVCPPSSVCNSPAVENGPVTDKPTFPPKIVDRSLSLEPEQLRHSGRVALTIAAYEGEPRTPTRLEFLPSTGRVSRASSKASSSNASTPGEDVDGSRMMLQNELVATLKRSNLKKLMEDDNVAVHNGMSHMPSAESKSAEEPKIEKSESIKATEEMVKKEIVEESNEIKPKEELKKNDIVEESIKVESMEKLENNKVDEDLDKIVPAEELENKSEDLDKIVSVEELENHSEHFDKIVLEEDLDNKSEIEAVLSELENSTEEILKEESDTVPAPPPMPEADKSVIKEELKTPKVDLENGEPKETLETVELTKDEAVVTPNGSVKQLAIELGKKMTFKADIERVPEQNGIKNE